MTTTAPEMNAAHKAWATRRARAAAAALMTSVAAMPAPAPVEAKPAGVHNVHTSADLVGIGAVSPVIFRGTQAVTDCQLVEISVDDSAVGSGRRLFVVLEEGDKMVRLFSPAKLVTITVDRKYFDKYGYWPARGVKRSRVAEIIRRNIALADKINAAKLEDAVSDGGADAVAALQLLEG